ncbi:MAG: hypothetical protein Q4A94_04015 [Plesiomonas sp.]|nr:hypothetical protein [Plesiomonas sp.]
MDKVNSQEMNENVTKPNGHVSGDFIEVSEDSALYEREVEIPVSKPWFITLCIVGVILLVKFLFSDL